MNVEEDPETGAESSAGTDASRERRRAAGGDDRDGKDTDVAVAEGEVRLDVSRLF